MAACAVLLSLVIAGLTSAFNLPNISRASSWPLKPSDTGMEAAKQGRTLTFAKRVAYQRAIEEVYWHHRIWPKENARPRPSLDEVVSQAQIEKKVENYLRDSQVLTDDLHQPLTIAELQAEMNRMAQHTEQPEVLREVFAALDNDPFVVAECLARPMLAERSLMNSHSADRTIYGEFTASARLDKKLQTATATTSGDYILPNISGVATCTNNSWTATNITNAPTARTNHTAVWTGTEMIVWGGFSGNQSFNTGARYNPSTDTWRSTSSPGIRTGGSAVWTGTEMIVWGGDGGAKYNPVTNTWMVTSRTNAPSYRNAHTAIWTGGEMIVWGGVDPFGFVLNTGGKYNPYTNSWTAMSTTNAPEARYHHTAIWTGSDMIVWGGTDVGQPGTAPRFFGNGRSYNPNADTWTNISINNAPVGRENHTAIWTGSEMIVWGGNRNSLPFNTGGKYNPATNSWTATNASSAPIARTFHTATWSGSEMIVWGGFAGPTATNTGGRYNPILNNWVATSTTGAPSARAEHTAIWTGSQLIIWGGEETFPNGLSTGGRYCAESLASQLSNISTRSLVQTGNNVMIGGFIVQGAQTKRLIVRAIGPELTQYGVPDALANTTLELHDRTGALIASNDNWQTTIIGGIIISNQVGEIRDSGHAPTDGRESAIIADLAPGNYTAIVRGVNDTSGVALVEVYDLSSDNSSILGNISTRSFVQTDDNVMIGGFIVQGMGAKRMIIRAIGPELTQYGVPDALANPRLELHNGAGALIGSNDDWQHTIIGGVITAGQVAAIQASGHAPADPSESAIIAELRPGNYTAIVRGVNNTTGVALVEVYDLQ